MTDSMDITLKERPRDGIVEEQVISLGYTPL